MLMSKCFHSSPVSSSMILSFWQFGLGEDCNTMIEVSVLDENEGIYHRCRAGASRQPFATGLSAWSGLTQKCDTVWTRDANPNSTTRHRPSMGVASRLASFG